MRQAIYDPKIVNLLSRRSVFMCGSETAIVTEEDVVFGFLQHLVGHFARAFLHWYRLFLLDNLSQFTSFPLVLHL